MERTLLKNIISALLLCFVFLWVVFPENSHTKRPLTYSEKKAKAKEMKKIAKILDVKCKYCHLEAKKGLRAGDFTLLTEDGEYAHDIMFPIAKQYKVGCDYCHETKDDLNDRGKRAEKDFDFIDKAWKQKKKRYTCASCHQPPSKKVTRPFLIKRPANSTSR